MNYATVFCSRLNSCWTNARFAILLYFNSIDGNSDPRSPTRINRIGNSSLFRSLFSQELRRWDKQGWARWACSAQPFSKIESGYWTLSESARAFRFLQKGYPPKSSKIAISIKSKSQKNRSSNPLNFLFLVAMKTLNAEFTTTSWLIKNSWLSQHDLFRWASHVLALRDWRTRSSETIR